MTVQVVLASLNGLRSLKKAEIQAMTIRDPGGRQQAEMVFLRNSFLVFSISSRTPLVCRH
jgi:hypothetical protein